LSKMIRNQCTLSGTEYVALVHNYTIMNVVDTALHYLDMI